MQVTWVEHVEVDDRSVHNLYRPLVNSGLAFGAKRWVGTLDRQCERLASAMASNIPNGDLGGKYTSPTLASTSHLWNTHTQHKLSIYIYVHH
jgi:hypothetical protein